MPTSVTTQLLPTLRSTVCLSMRAAKLNRKLLRRNDASSQRDFEAELHAGDSIAWETSARAARWNGSVPGRSRRRSTSSSSGTRRPSPARGSSRQVVASAVRVREQVDRRAELPLQLAARAEDLLAWPRSRRPARGRRASACARRCRIRAGAASAPDPRSSRDGGRPRSRSHHGTMSVPIHCVTMKKVAGSRAVRGRAPHCRSCPGIRRRT